MLGGLVLGCTNTHDWKNRFGATCAEYEQKHCSDGAFVQGHEWTGGSNFNSPEENCCACGKGIASLDCNTYTASLPFGRLPLPQ